MPLAIAGLGIASVSSASAATTAYRNLILGDSPVVYFEFDETAGTTADNSGTYGATHDGTASGTVTVNQTSADTFLGSAYSFGGGQVTAAALTSTLSEWTMEAWINFSDGGDSTVLSNDASGWNDDAIIGLNPESGISGVGANQFGISQQSAPGGPRDGVGTGTLNDDTWYHVALTASTSGSNMSVYLDGVLIASDTTPNVNFNFGPSDGLFVGAKRSNGSSLYGGLIDELAIYDTVLSQSDIAARANFNPIPEPSSTALLGLGGLALILRRRR